MRLRHIPPTRRPQATCPAGRTFSTPCETCRAIERLDFPAGRPRLPAATLRAEGYVNKLKEVDFSQMGGLTGQLYYEGVYELKDDEALIVETKLPEPREP